MRVEVCDQRVPSMTLARHLFTELARVIDELQRDELLGVRQPLAGPMLVVGCVGPKPYDRESAFAYIEVVLHPEEGDL